MLDLDLDGKTAVVSGSTAGIGYAAAVGLAAQGAHVVVTGRTQPRVDEAAARIRAAVPNARASALAADLTTAAGCAALVQAYPHADVLVNNLGIFEPRPFAEIDDADWLRFFEANVMSGVRLTRAYLPGMRARNWGRVIFVSSESGLQIPVEMIHEGVAGTGVTVNSVLPGPTKSEGVGTFVKRMAERQRLSEDEMERRFFETARPTSLLRRFLTPEEVANLIVYLCTPAASGTNGSALRVDGGVVRAIP